MLERLASEETEHVEEILRFYSGASLGSLTSLIAQPNEQYPPVIDEHSHKIAGHMTERHALGLALNQELPCLDRYETFVLAFRVPKIRKVFEQALHLSRSTNRVSRKSSSSSQSIRTELARMLPPELNCNKAGLIS